MQQAAAPAAARSSSRATGWPRCPCRGFRAAAPAGPGHCAGRSLRRSAAPAAVSAPWPRLRPHRPPSARSSGASAVVNGISGRRRATLQARPGLLQRRAAPSRPPPPPIPPSVGAVWPPPPAASWPRSPRSRSAKCRKKAPQHCSLIQHYVQKPPAGNQQPGRGHFGCINDADPRASGGG